MSTLEDFGLTTAPKPVGGGWRYEQVWQEQVWRIPLTGSAPTGDALVQQVKDFRVSAGIPLGDPVADVASYIKKVSPRNDRFKGRVIGAERVREITPLITDLRQWLDNTAAAKPRFVLNEVAQKRATVCLTCPQNIRWEVNGCGACNEDIKDRSYLLRKSRTVTGQDALLGCRLHRMHLPAAVHLDRDFHPPLHPDAPPSCWVQQTDG